ncbi:TPA: hypothetical protein EYP66_02520 [Candidatus Poribacteria bacterium]|nr:hypothetical protein [Candidatus Poribacteria bacterium]
MREELRLLATMGAEELYRIAAEKNFSRIPIYDGRIYNIIGLINILDVLYSESDSENGLTGVNHGDISPYIRWNIRFVPESKRVDAFRGDAPFTLQLAAKHRLHTACPVPVGIIKAVEVEAGLALPADATIKLSKPEDGFTS